MNKQIAILALATLVLAACGSAPTKIESRGAAAPAVHRAASVPAPGSGGYLAGDGPGADAPADLDSIPDAVPKNEPLHRYANRPYAALGKNYTPLTVPGSYKERGIASWYGRKFHGQRTSSGETYDMYGMTAAHPTLPIPSYARVTNVVTGKTVVVRVNDRGPFLHDRIMDLSYTAAHKLGIVGNGSAVVEVESLAPSAMVTAVAKPETVITRPLEQAEPPAKIAQASVAGQVFLQLGAFKSRDAAESFMEKMRAELGDIGQQLSLYAKDGLNRVHLGPYANQDDARSSAVDLQGRLGFKPMVNLR